MVMAEAQKRIRIVEPAEDFADASGDDADFRDTTDDEGLSDDDEEPMSPKEVTLQSVLARLDQLEMDIRSLVYYGKTYGFTKDRTKRRAKLMKLLDAIRIDLEFDDFMVTKK